MSTRPRSSGRTANCCSSRCMPRTRCACWRFRMLGRCGRVRCLPPWTVSPRRRRLLAPGFLAPLCPMSPAFPPVPASLVASAQHRAPDAPVRPHDALRLGQTDAPQASRFEHAAFLQAVWAHGPGSTRTLWLSVYTAGGQSAATWSDVVWQVRTGETRTERETTLDVLPAVDCRVTPTVWKSRFY